MDERVDLLRIEFNKLQLEKWIESSLFSAHWWITLFISLFFLIVFILLIDRNRKQEIILAFLISFIFIGMVNEIGYYFNLWDYPTEFIVFLQTFNAVDFLSVPIVITLLYQFFSRWKYFLIANVITSSIMGFIAIPIFTFFGFYEINNEKWGLFQSFLLLFIITLVVKSLMHSLKRDTK